MLINGKKGLMDDFTDLLSLVLIISMLGFFAVVVLRTDAGDKEDQTLERMESFRGQEALLDLLNSPVDYNGQEIAMKDFILMVVNNNNSDLFAEKMELFFEQRQMEGGVSVYNSVSYGTEEEPEPLLSYNNVVFLGEEKGASYLTNTEGTGNTKSIVIKLFG